MHHGKVIIIEGLIGAGKSTATEELAESLGPDTLVLFEPDERDNKNPYLSDYYTEPERWSFAMQIHLMGLRYRMYLQAQWHVLNTGGYALMDRSIQGDVSFARVQLQMGLMTQREFDTYQNLYRVMTANILLPSVGILLEVPPKVSNDRISKRASQRAGRSCEEGIELGYLMALDREIQNMMAVLEESGVFVLRVPWEEDRDTKEKRAEPIQAMASAIKRHRVPDLFFHRRVL